MSDDAEIRAELKRQQVAGAACAKRIAHRDRRERIATAAMAGMLANPNVDPWRLKIAVDAIFHADALIAELNKEVTP